MDIDLPTGLLLAATVATLTATIGALRAAGAARSAAETAELVHETIELWRDEPPVTLNAKTQMDLEEVRQTVRKIFDNTQDGGTGDGEGSKKLEEVRKNTLKLVTATAETQIASATLTQILELVERIAAQGDGRQTTADETAAAKPAKPATRDRRRTRREQRTASQKKNRPAPKTKTTADPIDAPTPTTPGGEATA